MESTALVSGARTHLTRRQWNAVAWLSRDGYVPVLGGLRNLSHFEMKNKDTGEIEYFDIEQVLNDYDQDRKDKTRMRAAERRAQKEKAKSS